MSNKAESGGGIGNGTGKDSDSNKNNEGIKIDQQENTGGYGTMDNEGKTENGKHTEAVTKAGVENLPAELGNIHENGGKMDKIGNEEGSKLKKRGNDEGGKLKKGGNDEGDNEKTRGKNTPKWVWRVWLDLKKKEFIPIKILYFLLFGAMMSLFPFLTLQARALGIREKELSLLFALNPIIAFVGPPLTGILADKIGNFKFLLSILMACSGAVGLGYLAVPEARRVVPLPTLLPYTLTLSSPVAATLTLPPGKAPVAANITLDHPHLCQYPPTLTNFTLTIDNCTLCHLQGNDSQWWSSDGEVEVKVVRMEDTNTTTTLMVTGYPTELLAHTKSSEGPSGAGAEGCLIMCITNGPSKELCTNTNTTEEFNPSATFFSYMFVRLANGVMLATSHTMSQGATMVILRKHLGDLGLQRLYGNMGAVVFTPISGVLIDVFSKLSGYEDFRPAFFLYFGLKLLASIVILNMDLDFRMPSDRVTKDFKSLLKNAEVLTFLVVMLITGAFFGLLDTFLFWLLEDLGAKKSLMGITVTVGTIAGIPILVASGSIIRTLGHANTIILGLASYVVRMIGYSYLTNPWWCMPFEMLECFTVSLLGTAATAYADDLATPATIATLQGMFGGIHYGVGRAVGSFIGGFLIAPFGIRTTFRIAAGVSAVMCVIYFVVNHFFFRKQQNERARVREERMKGGTEEENKMETNKILERVKGDIENNFAEKNMEEGKDDMNKNVDKLSNKNKNTDSKDNTTNNLVSEKDTNRVKEYDNPAFKHD